MSGGAWCSLRHDRAGIVSNQPVGTWDRTRPHSSVTTCELPECLEKAIKYVAGNTNETATYSSDAERGVK